MVLRAVIVFINAVTLALYLCGDSAMLLLSCTYATTANDACCYLLIPPFAHFCFFGAFYLTQPIALQHKYGAAALDRYILL